MTQSGTEPATFRLVAQCLNQMQHSASYRYLIRYLSPTSVDCTLVNAFRDNVNINLSFLDNSWNVAFQLRPRCIVWTLNSSHVAGSVYCTIVKAFKRL